MNERIKEVRKALHLTQAAFAGRVGVKQQTIAMLEAGSSNPSEQLINGICREYRVNEDWLRTGEGEMFVPTPSTVVDQLCEEYDLDGGARVVLEKFITLPPEEQEVIIGYMCSVVDAIREGKEQPKDPTPPPTDDDYRAMLEKELKKEKGEKDKSEA